MKKFEAEESSESNVEYKKANYDYINCVIQALLSHDGLRAFFSKSPEAELFKKLQQMPEQTKNLI